MIILGDDPSAQRSKLARILRQDGKGKPPTNRFFAFRSVVMQSLAKSSLNNRRPPASQASTMAGKAWKSLTVCEELQWSLIYKDIEVLCGRLRSRFPLGPSQLLTKEMLEEATALGEILIKGVEDKWRDPVFDSPRILDHADCHACLVAKRLQAGTLTGVSVIHN
jgi:hypothetical protein